MMNEKIKLSSKERNALWIAGRQFLYFVLVIGLMHLIRVLSFHFGIETFDEFGVIENMQLVCLILAASVFLGEAFVLKSDRTLLFLLSSAIIRFLCMHVCLNAMGIPLSLEIGCARKIALW